jgi:hypothetical protein
MRASMADGVVQREVGLALSRTKLIPYEESQATGCFKAWLTGLVRGPLLHAAMRQLHYVAVYDDVGELGDGAVDSTRMHRLDGPMPPPTDGEAGRLLDALQGLNQNYKFRYGVEQTDRPKEPSILASGVYYHAGRASAPPPFEGVPL